MTEEATALPSGEQFATNLREAWATIIAAMKKDVELAKKQHA